MEEQPLPRNQIKTTEQRFRNGGMEGRKSEGGGTSSTGNHR